VGGVIVKTPAKKLRDDFLAWQCRIRQIAMRQEGGRPSPGMRPRVIDRAGREVAAALTVLIVPKAPAETTALFRFQVQKTSDPREVYERGLALMQADYFQQPAEFSDCLTALLPARSALAAKLLAEGTCILEFDQFRQVYRLAARVALLRPADPAHEATLWHNRLFNPSLPDDVEVLSFRPDWNIAEATPAP
jgi:hypothetical protein